MSYSDIAFYFLTLTAITIAPGLCALVLIVGPASKDVLGTFGFGIEYAPGAVMITCEFFYGLGAWLTSVPEFVEYSKYLVVVYSMAGYGYLESKVQFKR